ncbi:Flavonoid 3'-monooxygenase [Morus notabilis]|uniref:Flavonoid 3'-monooxygenase n=1 Tax=Morus notabilis TaxID=981085 RepID=W9S051_9ROSA|nr:cytochrome P450 CYP736A12 [Morus notabilis]EXB80838.1 Flavonoid 3'-monooxygenase [Morus notabilis]
MAWTWPILVVLVVVAYVVQAKPWKAKGEKKKLPPGPKGFPLFGSMHLLGKFLHHDLHKLAKKYGPIMHMRLGLIPTIIVSSPEAAELFLKTHDLVFASRPHIEAAKYMFWEYRDLVFAPYGSYWRYMRKMCTLELLNSVKISSFKAIRKEEIGQLIDTIQKAARERVSVDLSAKVTTLNADMSCRMVFGKKYLDKEFDERGFKVVIQEAMHLAAIPNLGDFIPFIAPLDLQGYTKRMKVVAKVFDDFFEKIIEDHILSKDEDSKTKDFVDVMLSLMESADSEYRIERPNIKAVMLDMLVASMDTSASAIEWAISELIKQPRVLMKVQKELETVVGMERMVEETDLEMLEYLDMVVKETLRLHPVVPLFHHAAMEECTINGFHIPKKSRVIVNAWAIGRDPNAWNDPEKFIPERFLGSSIDLKGRDFQLIPFGAGRRHCPGLQLGLIVVKLVVAQLVHCFDWELPNGVIPTELDMTEEFGLTTPRANHLLAIPTYRLHK